MVSEVLVAFRRTAVTNFSQAANRNLQRKIGQGRLGQGDPGWRWAARDGAQRPPMKICARDNPDPVGFVPPPGSAGGRLCLVRLLGSICSVRKSPVHTPEGVNASITIVVIARDVITNITMRKQACPIVVKTLK